MNSLPSVRGETRWLSVRGFGPGLGLALALALSTSGCLDRGGLDPIPDAGTPRDGAAAADGRATGGDTGTATGGVGGDTGSGGASGGGAIGSGGRPMTHTGGATGTGGTGATGATGGAMATGGAKGTGGAGGTGGKMMCGAICDIYCQYGNVLDANGCPTCKCNPMPTCPQIKCQADCPNGYTKDANGCPTCTCVPDACTAADCGPMPATTSIVCPASMAAPTDTGAAPMDLVAPPPFTCTRDASGKCFWQSSSGCHICPALPCQACPNGYEIGADGCSTCTCKPAPPSMCGSYTSMATCAADVSCRWLQPGCTEPALAAAGCFATASLGCTSDAACGAGHQCLKRMVQPCPGGKCAACAVSETICQ